MSDDEPREEESHEPLQSYLPPGYNTGFQEAEPQADITPETAGWISLGALRVTLGRVPLWLITAMVPLALAMIGALSWYGWFRGALDHHYAPGSQLGWLTDNFRTDNAGALESLGTDTGRIAAGMTFIMFIVGVFTAGGWLQVFLERTEGHSVHRFFYGGARYFWRFFRVFLAVVILLGLGNFLIYGDLWNDYVLERLFHVSGGELENLTSEKTARNFIWLQDGVFALWLAMVLVWADYLRTRLAFHGSRSVVWSGLATVFMLLLRPISTLRPMIVLFFAELVVLVGAGSLSTMINRGMDESTGQGTVWMLFAITGITIIWRTIVHAARYHAAVQVTRVIVEPLGVDDPWENTVGGPGGPRYPVGEEDFEISI
jgi:hypothetical protein